MKIEIRIRHVVLLAILAFELIARGAEVSKSTALFGRPDEGSDQLIKLDVGDKVHVVGESVEDAELSWLPVVSENHTGYVRSSSLKLQSNDFGYVFPPENQAYVHRVRAFGSIGPTLVLSNENVLGARIAIGLDLFLGSSRKWTLGGTISSPIADEKSSGIGGGRISRINFLVGPGYYLVADRFYLQGLLGLSTISGADENFYGKIKPTIGALLGFRLPWSENQDWGLSLSFEHTGEAHDAISQIGASSGCAIGAALTFQKPDPSCSNTGIAPAANVVSINLTVGLNP